MHNIDMCCVPPRRYDEAMSWLTKVLKLYDMDFEKDNEKTTNALGRIERRCFALESVMLLVVIVVFGLSKKGVCPKSMRIILTLVQLFRCT